MRPLENTVNYRGRSLEMPQGDCKTGVSFVHSCEEAAAMNQGGSAFDMYPSSREVDVWIDGMFKEAERIPCRTEIIRPDAYAFPTLDGYPYRYGVRHNRNTGYVMFIPEQSDVFYGFWQPALSGPAPLLIHVPGYGAEVSAHPEIVSAGYSVLHINPLGYCTPEGMDVSKTANPEDPLAWPVLPDSITSLGKNGYRQWFINCIHAIRWALGLKEVLPGRVSFFGTSQGGGASLILASIYKDRGVRCVAADLPFLTNFPLADGRGAYRIAKQALDVAEDKSKAWHALGFFDTLSHVHRLTLPVLLTAGGCDDMCPPETVVSLFEKLQGIRSLTILQNSAHAYSPEFIPLVKAWMNMYA